VRKQRRRQVVNPAQNSIRYWEAWPVSRLATSSTLKLTVGEVLVGMLGFKPDDVNAIYNTHPFFTTAKGNDVFSDMIASPRSRGEVIAQGAARFYSVTLPPDFILNNPRTQAGKLLRSTVQKPDFWTGEGTFHLARYQWDFTGAVPKEELKTSREASWQTSAGVTFTPRTKAAIGGF
jgi:hypothetical protein